MKHTFLLLIFTNLFLVACKKVDKFTQFNMEYDDEVSIPSSTTVNLPFNILTPDMETNSESTFEVNDTRKDKVEKITLTSLDLTLISPSNSDFSFLKSISVYISASDLPEIVLASKTSISDSVGKFLTLDVSGSDFKEYIKKDKFSLRLNAETDKLVTSDHNIKIHSKFFVDAKVLGQ